MEFNLVYIEWLDHAAFEDSGWKSLEKIQSLRPCIVRSVGWLVKEEDDYIIIVATLQRYEEGFQQPGTGEMLILKSTIQERYDVVKSDNNSSD